MVDFTRRALRPDHTGVHGTLFLPHREKPASSVIVIGGSGGSELTYVAEAFAAKGIAALSLAYFARSGLPKELRAIPLEYFRDALRVLTDAVSSQSVPVLALGGSRGSEPALLCAIHFRDLIDGVVVSVPGNIVSGGWPSGGPAWLLNGQPLPYVDHSGPVSEDPDAIIPVERVRGPILLISAGADEVWPSAAMARAIAERLDLVGHAYGHRLLEYPGAGHSLGYLVPNLPPGLLPSDLSDSPVTQKARSDAWPKVVDFVRECPITRREQT